MGHFHSLGAGPSRRATNPNTGGRPAQRLAGTIPRTGEAEAVADTTLVWYDPLSSCILAPRFLSPRFCTFLCVCRPRRFGTTVVLSLLMDTLFLGMSLDRQTPLGEVLRPVSHLRK